MSQGWRLPQRAVRYQVRQIDPVQLTWLPSAIRQPWRVDLDAEYMVWGPRLKGYTDGVTHTHTHISTIQNGKWHRTDLYFLKLLASCTSHHDLAIGIKSPRQIQESPDKSNVSPTFTV